MANVQRMYDLKEYAEKARLALLLLAEKQQPSKVEKGSKSDVISSVKAEIKNMLDKGYTAQQIADAFKDNDVFAILPKSITELVLKKKKVAVKRDHKKGSSQSNKQGNEQGNEQSTKHVTSMVASTNTNKKQKAVDPAQGSFYVKPDSEDI